MIPNLIRCSSRHVAYAAVILSLVCGTMATLAGDGDKTPQAVSLLGKPLLASPQGADLAKLEADLAAARAALAANPDSEEAAIWVGRRLGYLWRMNEAIAAFSQGIKKHPASAALYRHRGHRYISVRQFDRAIADLEKAAELMRHAVDVVEKDGQPNRLNVPLTTLKYNIYYHLGVARYLKGDFQVAVKVFREAQKHVRVVDDNRIAIKDWMYMSLRRLGHHSAAKSELIGVDEGMSVIENGAYYRRLRMYAGAITPERLIPEDASELDRTTMLYGLGNWYRCRGEAEKAKSIFERIVGGSYWPAFAYIAAEVDLAGLKGK